MSGFEYSLDQSTGVDATLGLIVLGVDETIEGELRRLLPMRDIALHISRIPSGAELTPETIAQMGIDLPSAVGLLPSAPRYDAIAYACTSGVTLLGREQVADLIRGVRDTDLVLDPLGAVIADCEMRRVHRLGVVTPYTTDVGQSVTQALNNAGIEVTSQVHFGEMIEANVARIASESIAKAAEQVAATDVDAVFLSCTNLRTLDLISPLEAAIGKTVLSSNLSLARALARAAGKDVVMPAGEP